LYLALVGAQSEREICEEDQMMRCINRNLHRVGFHRIETKPLKTIYGDIPVTWNSEKRAVAAKITRPLRVLSQPRKWAQLAHEDKPEDWITEESWLI
jgi:hypothetical protein